MYAILETGGKQYKVQKGDTIDVERLDTKAGHEVKLNKVLLYSKGKSIEVGKPHVKGAHVVCEVVRHLLADKVITFKYRRRKNSRKKIGHRQDLTRLRIKEMAVE